MRPLAYAGHHGRELESMLGIVVVDWELCWAYAGHRVCELGPMPGLILFVLEPLLLLVTTKFKCHC